VKEAEVSAFLGVSLWVALATVVPGLVTIACICGAYLATHEGLALPLEGTNEWVLSSVAITVMVLTQGVGILLEELLVRLRGYGRTELTLHIPAGIDGPEKKTVEVKPYEEYGGIYLLLAELGPDEDAQGHLKRALAQFFLTNNTLVSFTVGAALTLVFRAVGKGDTAAASRVGVAYAVVMIVLLLVSYCVARIRFRVMAKSIWAARRKRIAVLPLDSNAGEDFSPKEAAGAEADVSGQPELRGVS
jgi:hypothetical protein